VRWPGVIPAGRSTEQPAITMDWTATILGISETPADAAYPLDGENLLPVCTGTRAPYDRTLFWRSLERDAARFGRWKYLKDSGTERLFDLSIDPGEKTDLRLKHADVFADIKRRYSAWNASVLPRPSG
jgi:arylsulfatase A-like enzyme